MVPRNTLSDWVALYDDARALHWRLDGGWLIVHAFAVTDAGVLDLRGFHVEPCTLADANAVGKHVQELGERWDIAPGPPLTSRRLRVAAAQGASLAEARQQLPVVSRLIDLPPPADAEPSRDLAKLVVRYAKLLGAGPGARAQIAAEEGVGEDAIKARLLKARQQGLWITSTSGKAGQPSALAHQLAREGQQ